MLKLVHEIRLWAKDAVATFKTGSSKADEHDVVIGYHPPPLGINPESWNAAHRAAMMLEEGNRTGRWKENHLHALCVTLNDDQWERFCDLIHKNMDILESREAFLVEVIDAGLKVVEKKRRKPKKFRINAGICDHGYRHVKRIK